MSVKFIAKGDKCKILTDDHLVAFDAIKGCSEWIDINCKKGTIHLTRDPASFYTVEVNFTANARCPIDEVTLCLLNLKTQEILASVVATNKCENLLKFGGILPVDTKLAFGIKSGRSGLACAELKGSITENFQQYQDCLELERDTSIDEQNNVQYIASKPGNLPCPAAPFEDQTITAGDNPVGPGTLLTTANVIPWYPGQPSANLGPPPPPGPPVSNVPYGLFTNQAPVTTNYYRKFASIPYQLAYYAGLSFETIPPNSPVLTVFLKNFEDRGANNQSKTDYIFALTNDKLPFYKNKIVSMVNNIHAATVTNGAPVVSTSRRELVQFFLDVHVGTAVHPPNVVKYFTQFIDIIGFISNPNIDIDPLLKEGRNLEPEVRAYFAERIESIIANKDETSLTFHWNRAGLPLAGLVTESLHNIIAFAQFVNTFYLAIADKFYKANPGPQPHWIPPNPIPVDSFQPLPGPLSAYNIVNIDFFDQLKQITNETARLDVVRELFRLLGPNSNAFSALNDIKPDASGAGNFEVRHIWTQMSIQQQPILPGLQEEALPLTETQRKAYSFFNYRLNPVLEFPPLGGPNFYRYLNFETALTVPPPVIVPQPGLNQNLNSIDFVEFSPFDTTPGATAADGNLDGKVIDKSNPKAQPTFNYSKINEGALPFPYYPFGTSYRSCPGELFNYLVTELWIDKFKDVQFEYREVQPPCDGSNPDTSRYVAIAPRRAVFDNVFVKGPTFPV